MILTCFHSFEAEIVIKFESEVVFNTHFVQDWWVGFLIKFSSVPLFDLNFFQIQICITNIKVSCSAVFMEFFSILEERF